MMTRSFFFLLNASPDSPSSFLPPLIHFSFLEPVSPPQTVRFTWPGYLGVFDPGKLLWALQAEPAPSRRLVSLPVTFVAIWAGTRVCPFSPGGQDLGRELADAPLGLRFRDSRHLLVICRYSGVRGFQRLPSLESLHGVHWLSDCGFLTPASHPVSGQTPALSQAATSVMIVFFALSRASHQVPTPSWVSYAFCGTCLKFVQAGSHGVPFLQAPATVGCSPLCHQAICLAFSLFKL